MSGAERKKDALKKVAEKLPHKQRLILEYGQQLASLVDKYPGAAFYADDQGLSENLGGVLEKIGFDVQQLKKVNDAKLINNIIAWKAKGVLTLIHYKPEAKSSSIINLFRKLKQQAPFFTYETVVPIFIGAPGQKKQQEVFKALGAFGVKFGCFLTPGIAPDQNVEELLDHLKCFAGMEKTGDVSPIASERIEPEKEVEEIGEYKELLEHGDSEMNKHHFEEAAGIFTQALDIKPNFKALVRRGDAYYKLKQYASALKDYRDAHMLELNAPGPYAKIGSCCFVLTKTAARKNDTAAAQKWFSKGMESVNKAKELVVKMENEPMPEMKRPNPYADVAGALVEADFRGAGLEEAEQKVSELMAEVMEQTMKIDCVNEKGMDADEKIDIGILLARDGRYAEAEEILRSAIETDSSAATSALNNFAVELRKNGENAKAVDIYMELMQRDDVEERQVVTQNLMKAVYRRAEELAGLDQVEESKQLFDNAVNLVSKNEGKEWALLDFAMWLLETQDQAAASSKLIEAMYINPKLFELKKFTDNYSDLSSLKQEILKKLTRGAL